MFSNEDDEEDEEDDEIFKLSKQSKQQTATKADTKPTENELTKKNSSTKIELNEQEKQELIVSYSK